jgi:hypothetical protein
MTTNGPLSADETLKQLQVRIAEADLRLKEAELKHKASLLGWARSPAGALAIIALVLPLWIGLLTSHQQQALEVKKLESDLISKAMLESRERFELQERMHNLLKGRLVVEKKDDVCDLLRKRGLSSDEC